MAPLLWWVGGLFRFCMPHTCFPNRSGGWVALEEEVGCNPWLIKNIICHIATRLILFFPCPFTHPNTLSLTHSASHHWQPMTRARSGSSKLWRGWTSEGLPAHQHAELKARFFSSLESRNKLVTPVPSIVTKAASLHPDLKNTSKQTSHQTIHQDTTARKP